MEDIKLESIKLIANKLKRQRIEKHESLIHRVVNEYFIRKGKSFLKNEFITVMGIKLSPDLSVALIFISVLNNKKTDFVENVLTEKKHDVKQFIVKSIGKKIMFLLKNDLIIIAWLKSPLNPINPIAPP